MKFSDLIEICKFSYKLGSELNKQETLKFYKQKIIKLDELYKSNDKNLISLFFLEEAKKSNYSNVKLLLFAQQLNTISLEEFKTTLTYIANDYYKQYLYYLNQSTETPILDLAEIILRLTNN
jgi:hypothetical protein